MGERKGRVGAGCENVSVCVHTESRDSNGIVMAALPRKLDGRRI